MKYQTIEELITHHTREVEMQKAILQFIVLHGDALEDCTSLECMTGWNNSFYVTIHCPREDLSKYRSYFTRNFVLNDSVWEKRMGSYGAKYENSAPAYEMDMKIEIRTELPPTCHLEYEEVEEPARTYKRAVVKCEGQEVEAKEIEA